MVIGAGVHRRHRPLPDRRHRRCQSAEAVSPLRRVGGDQGRRACAGHRRHRLGGGAGALAAPCCDCSQWRRLGRHGRRGRQPDRLALVHPHASGALSMAYNGASVGGIVFSPLWVAAIALLSFPVAAPAIGVVTAVTVWLLADLTLSKTPQQMGLRPDGDAIAASSVPVAASSAKPLPGTQLWRDPRFLTLAAGMALGLFAQIGLIAHLFSLLVPALGAQSAGLAMAAATASAIVGRTLVGWVMPAGADRRLVACASYGVQIAGVVAFIAAAGTDITLLWVGIMLFG